MEHQECEQMSLSLTDLMEHVTGELYRRFVLANASWELEPALLGRLTSLSQLDAILAVKWARYFESIVPTLRAMINGVQTFTTSNNVTRTIILTYRVLEYGWVGNSRSGGEVEYERRYESHYQVSSDLLTNLTSTGLTTLQAEVDKALVRGFTNMFELYLAEGLCPIAWCLQDWPGAKVVKW